MKYAVELLEYEKGWGNRLDDTKYFDSFAEAEKFMKEFNNKNDKEEVPDWYMVAKGPFKV